MSARRAANALVRYDADVAEAIKVARGAAAGTTWGAAEGLATYLRGCWTLSLAAAAANTTEEKIVAALLLHFAGAGTSADCRRLARAAFK